MPSCPFFGWSEDNISPDPEIDVNEDIISFNVNGKYSGANNKYSGSDCSSSFYIAAVPSLSLFNWLGRLYFDNL
jgi:hypothetical protein